MKWDSEKWSFGSCWVSILHPYDGRCDRCSTGDTTQTEPYPYRILSSRCGTRNRHTAAITRIYGHGAQPYSKQPMMCFGPSSTSPARGVIQYAPISMQTNLVAPKSLCIMRKCTVRSVCQQQKVLQRGLGSVDKDGIYNIIMILKWYWRLWSRDILTTCSKYCSNYSRALYDSLPAFENIRWVKAHFI